MVREDEGMSASSGFLCVCSEKSVQIGCDAKLERAFQSLAIKRHLENVPGGSIRNKHFVYLPGAGIVYDSEQCHSAVDGCLLAVFVGELDNYAYLVNKYCLAAANLDTSRSWRLETLREMSPLSNAQVVMTLYGQLGASFVPKLKGTFQFCLYDARAGRVLAANDANASRCLWQAHLLEDNSLIVGCGIAPPVGLLEGGMCAHIGAGEYKYGWRSVPIVYGSSKSVIKVKATDAMHAAMAALAGAVAPQPAAVAQQRSAARSVPAPATAPCRSEASAPVSYVPPHKRAAPSPSAVARSWRRSVDSAPAGTLPLHAPNIYGRGTLSMDQPDRSQAFSPPSRGAAVARQSGALAPRTPLSAPPGKPSTEPRSIPINIPPKSAAAAPPPPSSASGKLVMAKLGTPSESDASSLQSAFGMSMELNKSPGSQFQHQDSMASQLQFSMSHASMATESGADSTAKARSTLAQVLDHLPGRLPALPGAMSAPHGPAPPPMDADLFCDWAQEPDSQGSGYQAAGAWGSFASGALPPSSEVIEANRLLLHAAKAAAGAEPGAALAAAAGDRPALPSHSGAEMSLAGGISGVGGPLRVDRAWFGDALAPGALDWNAPALGAARTPTAALPVFGAALEPRLSAVEESPDNSVQVLPAADGQIPAASRDASRRSASVSLLPALFAAPEQPPATAALVSTAPSDAHAAPLPPPPTQFVAAAVSTGADMASTSPVAPADALTAPPAVVDDAASDDLLSMTALPAVKLPAADAAGVAVAEAPAVPEAGAEAVDAASAAEDAGESVGTSLARLNRAVEEAHMAREVTRLMAAVPLNSNFPGVPPIDEVCTSDAGAGFDAGPVKAGSMAGSSDQSGPGSAACLPRTPSTPHSTLADAGTPTSARGMGLRVGSFPMALAALLHGRSSPNLAAASGGASACESPGAYVHSSLRPRGASPASGLSPATSGTQLHRLARPWSPSPLAPGELHAMAPAHGSSRALSGYASPLRAASVASHADSAASSPRAALPRGDAVQKLPTELLDELTGGSEEPEVKAMLANLLYSSPCALCIVDAKAPDQPIVYVNAIFELQTGYSYDEVKGKNCRFLQHQPGTPRAPSFQSIALKRAIAMGRSHACKILNYAKDGAPMWNQLSIVPVRAKSGDVSHYVGMQTFTPAHRPSAVAPRLAGMAASKRSGSFAVLAAFIPENEPGPVQRSSSHALLMPLGGHGTPPAMVS